MAVFQTTEISGISHSIESMRLPFNSKGDSVFKNYQRVLPSDKVLFRDRDDAFVLGPKDEELVRKLGMTKPGTGHNNFLKGITVHFSVNATHAWWIQCERYHWMEIVSSASKMHSITKGSIADKCSKWVSLSTIEHVDNLIDFYNSYDDDIRDNNAEYWKEYFADTRTDYFPETRAELFECIVHNTPIGYQLKAGMVTNYLQLKTVYAQRKTHKLSEWNTDFADWVKTLPLSYLIIGDDNEDS